MQRQLPKLTAATAVRPFCLGCACFLLLATLAPACATTTGSIGAVLGQSKEDGRLTVREAPAGMAAASAGLSVGDEVMMIDGRDVRAMSPEEVHRALEGEVGSTVRLTVLRHGQIEHVEVRREPLKSRP